MPGTPGSGKSDAPLTDWGAEYANDQLKISGYVKGLTDYIQSCETPMSIALQGSWGTGKTSLMYALKARLDKRNMDCKTVYFNTWQYSQFRMSDDLYASFASQIKAELVGKNRNNGLKKAGEKFIGGVTRLLRNSAPALLADAFFLLAEYGLSQIGKSETPEEEGAEDESEKEETKEKKLDLSRGLFQDRLNTMDSGVVLRADLVTELKKDFQNLVNKAVGKSGRVVIFVDDLDRLDSSTAVELLEVIKLFMDVEKCVFVLAVDYEVVVRGVRKKYDKTMSMRKCQDFFKKIVQLPFRMPVERYDIKNMFEKVFVNDFGTEEIMSAAERQIRTAFTDALVDQLKASQGTNPREIKRLYNYYLLYKILPVSGGGADDGGPSGVNDGARTEKAAVSGTCKNALTASSLILQMTNPDAYLRLREMVLEGDGGSKTEGLHRFLNPEPDKTEKDETKAGRTQSEDDAEIEAALKAHRQAVNAITEAEKGNQEIFSDSVYEAYIEILERTYSTAVEERPAAKQGRRYALRIGYIFYQYSGGELYQIEITSGTAKSALIKTYKIILEHGIEKYDNGSLVEDFMNQYPDRILTYDREKSDGVFAEGGTELKLRGYNGPPVYIGTSSQFALENDAASVTPGDWSTQAGQVDRLCEFMRDNGIPVRVLWESPEGDFPYSWPRPWPGWMGAEGDQKPKVEENRKSEEERTW